MNKMIGWTAAAVLALGTTVSAQTVTFTEVLDINATTAGSAFSGDYNPAGDEFLVGGASTLEVFDGTTGAKKHDLDVTVPAPSGLGFFGVMCADDGRVFGFENTATTIWLYADTAASTTPTTAVGTGAGFVRTGQVVGAGASTILATAGSGDNGPALIYTTADGLAYTLADTAEVQTKSGLAINAAVTKTWAVGDVGTNNIQKFEGTVGGTWTEETATWPVTTDGDGSGPLAYDDTNNVLFAVPMGGTNNGNVYALDGDSGATLGSAPVDNAPFGTTGYCGADADGSVFAAMARAATGAVFYKFTYVYSGGAAVTDWSVY